MYLSVEEYDSWAVQTQGLTLSHVRFLAAVNRVLFGRGECYLSGREIERRAKLTSRTRLRVMRDLESSGLISVEEKRSHSGIVRYTIRRAAITVDRLIAFAKERWGRGLDNSIQVRTKKGKLIPGLHESMFDDTVGDKLVLEGDSPDSLVARFVGVATRVATRVATGVRKKGGVDTGGEKVAVDGGHKKRKVRRKKSKETNEPTACVEASLREPLKQREIPDSSLNKREVDGLVSLLLSEVDRRLNVFMTDLGHARPEPPSKPPRAGVKRARKSSKPAVKKSITPARSGSDIAKLQMLVIELAGAHNLDHEVKSIRQTNQKKLQKAVDRLGGAAEAEAYLRHCFAQGHSWLANFDWKDMDLYLLLCTGAVKEWRSTSGRVAATELATTKTRRVKTSRREQALKRGEWDGTESGIGEW